eukprot:TRINITY_DN583_c1_g1_i1.p3 TRINITY_DN583_c1_g1~~TRINITY_DN583_c1_g1_i1.p3  ORF type:complete len:150 (-),score=26.18 TRINITY_DN583_c1_g1_i1:42-491(-)
MGRKHVSDPTSLADRKARNTDLVAPPGFDEGVKRRDGRLYPGLSAAKVRDAFLDIVRAQPRVTVLGQQQEGGAWWLGPTLQGVSLPRPRERVVCGRPPGGGRRHLLGVGVWAVGLWGQRQARRRVVGGTGSGVGVRGVGGRREGGSGGR